MYRFVRDIISLPLSLAVWLNDEPTNEQSIKQRRTIIRDINLLGQTLWSDGQYEIHWADRYWLKWKYPVKLIGSSKALIIWETSMSFKEKSRNGNKEICPIVIENFDQIVNDLFKRSYE